MENAQEETTTINKGEEISNTPPQHMDAASPAVNTTTKSPPTGYTQSPRLRPPPYQQYHHPQPTNHSSTIALAITAGTVLGITAAAAVRWLNGGDFCLFPPAIVPEDETHDENTTMVRSPPSHHVDDLIERVQNQTDRQQEAVNKLQAVVDHLELQQQQQDRQTPFRPEPDSAPSDILSTLQDIRSTLIGIQDEIRQTPASSSGNGEMRLERTLDQLDSTLHQLQGTDRTSPPHSPLPTTSFSRTPVRVSTDTSISASTTNSSSAAAALVADPAAANTGATTTTLATRNALHTAICVLVNSNDAADLRIGAQLLYLYVVNVQRNPRVPRYRRIYVANESFQQNVARLSGVNALLESVGFVEYDEGYWEWLPPSVHNTDAIEPSPKQAWLSDSEAIYLDRLKEAELALAVLKTNGSTLVEALRAAGHHGDSIPLTPQGTGIMSPPDTKKHATLASPCFDNDDDETNAPPMHPLANDDVDDGVGGIVTPPSMEKAERDVDDDHETMVNATEALWK